MLLQRLWTAAAAGILLAAAQSDAVALPPCQDVAPAEQSLASVQTAFLDTPEVPFGVAFTVRPGRAFVALKTSLAVLDTTAAPPSILSEVALPPDAHGNLNASGISLSHRGTLVLVTLGTMNVAIVDVAKALAGSTDAVVGVLEGPTNQGTGYIEVTLSQDDQFAFVSQEYGPSNAQPGSIVVFSIAPAAADGSISGTYVGSLTLGHSVVGSALSPDGSILYVTSEINDSPSQGTLSLIDVATLQSDPSNALLRDVYAGCQPVRVIASSDGSTVWVTARQSNYLLGYDAAKLSSGDDPLIAAVQVGTSPVGLAFAADESRILVADSNRFRQADATAGISVVDVQAALAGQSAVLGQIPSGLFPREVALGPAGRIALVSNAGSRQVEAINIATLP